MADFNGEGNVFGGVEFEPKAENQGVAQAASINENEGTMFRPVEADKLPVKQGVWSKIRAFLFQEIDLNAPIKVELTPYQQKVEDEINDFLHQEVSFKGFFNIMMGKK